MSFALSCMLLVIFVFCPETDGRNLTWNEPPPTQIVRATVYPVKHNSSRQLFIGTTNATLCWHFTLADLKFTSLVVFFEGNSVARVSSEVTGTPPNYAHRFGLDWDPNQNLLKLYIFNVTAEENGTFSCRVTAESLDKFSEFQFASDVQVDVVVSPKVTLAEKFFVGRGEAASLFCQVEGNPKPTISWSPCDLQNVLCDTQYLNISKVEMACAIYNCTATNALGIDSATTVLITGGYNIYTRIGIGGEFSGEDSVWETLEKEFDRVFANTQSYAGAELTDASSCFSCGCLIFDVVLKFRTEVAEDETISTIQTATVDGKLGSLSLNASSIIGIPPVQQTSTAAPTSTPPNSDVSAGPPWTIIVTGIVLLAIVAGVLIWWVHKQGKCRKDTEMGRMDNRDHLWQMEMMAQQEREAAEGIPKDLGPVVRKLIKLIQD